MRGGLLHRAATMRLGIGEYVVLAIILFFIFSASRMGQLGNALGKFVFSFKKASRGDGFVEGKTLARHDEPRGATRPRGPSPEDAELVDDPNGTKPRS